METPHKPSTDDWSLTSCYRLAQPSPRSGIDFCYRSYDQEMTSFLSLMRSHTTSLSPRFNDQHSTRAFGDPFLSATVSDFPNLSPMACSVAPECESYTTDTNPPHQVGYADAISNYCMPSADSSLEWSTPPPFSTADDTTANASLDQCHAVVPFGYSSLADSHPNPNNQLGLSISATTENFPEFAMRHAVAFAAPSSWEHVQPGQTRPLFCIFHYAGCTLRFTSKNEWKRHIMYQHLNLQYWVCTEGGCGLKRRPVAEAAHASSLPTRGTIFNRKDLYTQHIRRMHLMCETSPVDAGSASSDKVKNHMRTLQSKAARTRCTLPRFMLCPVADCAFEFADSNCWDNWMEHVAGHMQRAANGEEGPVSFGGRKDWTLTEWATSEAVCITYRTMEGKWALCRPIQGRGSQPTGGRVAQRK